MQSRQLARAEIRDLWTIDRSESIDAMYRLENGALVLHREHHDVEGWPPGEPEKYTPMLEACFDRGGWFQGLFDEGRLIGVAVLDNRFIGQPRDQLQLSFLHVSRSYRDMGWGRRLFESACAEAKRRGARRMYVSATPSEHTVRFYLSMGCAVSLEPDAELLALEPDDIHFECVVRAETGNR